MFCVIYKSRKRQDTYLFLTARDDFTRVPEPLLKLVGETVHVMDLELTPERRLAQADTTEVMDRLREQGWYLQLPPPSGLH